jgi:hypothetical protein
MLTKLRAYSAWKSAPALPLDDSGQVATDLVQIRNITGLDPVKAAISTSPFGSFDGAAYTGASVDSRNIVLTIHPNPDWKDWTYEELRRLLYLYFMPKQAIQFVFYSNDISPVEIFGYVESCAVNQFSKDLEVQVSVICPYPYFTGLSPVVVTGHTVAAYSGAIEIDYNGDVESGFQLEVDYVPGQLSPNSIGIQVDDPSITYFTVNGANLVTVDQYFLMSSIPGLKYVDTVRKSSGAVTSLYSGIKSGSSWPTLKPGANQVAVITDQGAHTWKLTYFERHGGL